MLVEKIKHLEIQFCHLEEFAFQLNKIVIKQQSEIEQLTKEILALKTSQSNGTSELSLQNLADEVPPHY